MVPRLVLALAVVAALLAPGCLQQETPASTAAVAPAAAPDVRPELKDLKVLPEVRLGVAQIGAEPNIAAAPDGTLYVTTPDYLWRSDDAGKTWNAIGKDACDMGLVPATPPVCPPGFEKKDPGLDGGGDGDIAVGANGTLYWAGLSGDSGPIPFQASADKGVTWTPPVDLSNKTGFDREWIDAWGNGHLAVGWRDSHDGRKLAFRHSGDGGKTWDPVRYWTGDHLAGPVVHDPNSTSVYVPYVENGKGIVVGRTDDLGLHWTSVLAVPLAQAPALGAPTSIFPVAAVDDAGTVYLVYSSDDTLPDLPVKVANRAVVHLVESHDKGVTWSKPVVLSPEGHTALYPWIAAGKPGRVAIAWYEGTLGTPSEAVPDLWDVHLVESVTADAEKPVWKGTFLNAQPTHIGTVCTDGLLCSLTGRDRSLLDFFEVTIAPNGQPYATWSGDANVRQLSATVFAGGLSEGAPLR